MKIFLFTLVLTAITAAWWINRQTTLALRATVLSLRVENDRLPRLRDERARLQKLQRVTTNVDQLPPRAIDLVSPDPTESLPSPKKDDLSTTLVAGDWVPASAWQRRGDQTPKAAVETALWSAAGGDVAQLKKLLLLDDDVREKSAEIFGKLPAQVRAKFLSPEDLIAALTIKSIPMGHAQLIWHQQTDEDHAVLGLFLKGTEPAPAGIKTLAVESASNGPPYLSANPMSKSVYLSLRRTPQNEWRLIVPISAVTKLANEFASSATP